MKKDLKNVLFGFAIGGIVFGTIGVLAYSYQANQVSYTTSKNDSVQNVEQAINDLYDRVSNGPTKENAPSGATYKGIVYLDPTNLKRTCNANDVANNVGSNGSPTEVKTGCMKWYIYSEDNTNNTYTMILDHNTTAKVQWNVSNINVAYASSLVKPYVDALVTTNGWKVTPRLITASEIKTITNNPNFDLSAANWYCFESKGKDSQSKPYCNNPTNSKYAWLFDYTYDCESDGCTYNDNNTYVLANNTSTTGGTYGYWTSDTVGSAGADCRVWVVNWGGHMWSYEAINESRGIRPVITISKSIISK